MLQKRTNLFVDNILLEAIFVAGGIIVKELTDLSTIAAASAVIVASLIAMAILYYPEIKAFTNRSWGGAINRIKISEETMTNILGPIAILFLFGFVLWIIFVVVRVIKYAWQIP